MKIIKVEFDKLPKDIGEEFGEPEKYRFKVTPAMKSLWQETRIKGGER